VLVRSLLVPALAYDIGPRIWWPGRLGRPELDAAARRDDEALQPESESAGRR
jgi:RND superfamily putative drug exporter